MNAFFEMAARYGGEHPSPPNDDGPPSPPLDAYASEFDGFRSEGARSDESPNKTDTRQAPKIIVPGVRERKQHLAKILVSAAHFPPPSGGGYPDIEGLRQLAKEGARRIGDREAFRQLNLNIWLDHATDPFVEMPIYDEGAHEIDLEDLEARQVDCWLAVDLSSNSDLTVIVACWRDGDGFQVHPWFFCPEENLRAREELAQVPYTTWAEEGFITATPGNVVDFRAVEEQLRELCGRFNVREIAFDPHLARNMLNNLLEDGFPAVEMRQGWVTMAPAVKELERAIIGRRFRHGGHPVLRWNFANIEVRTDPAGNRMFHKGKSRDKIDGAVAAAMAVARCAAGEGGMTTSADWFSDDLWLA